MTQGDGAGDRFSRRQVLAGLGAVVGVGTSGQAIADSGGSDSTYRIGLPLEQQWEFGFADSAGISGPPVSMGAVTEDTIYASLGETDRDPAKLVALDRSNHDRRWESTVDREVSAPSVVDGRLFVTGGSEILAFPASEQPNEPTWRSECEYDYVTRQTLFGDAVCHAAYDVATADRGDETRYYLRSGATFAYTHDGEPLWEQHGQSMHTPVYRNETLFQLVGERYWQNDELHTESGSVVARAPETGKVEWETPDHTLEFIRPASDQGWILAASPDGSLFGFDMETGDQQFTKNLGRRLEDVTSSSDYIFTAAGQQLTVLDAETREVVWHRDDLGPLYDLTYDGGLLFVGTRNAEFFALDAASGKQVWKHSMFRGEGYERIHDGVLYTVARNWIASFEGQRGKALKAVNQARREGALGSVAKPIANALGRDRALARAEQAIEDQRYDAAMAAVRSATLRQGAVEAGLVAVAGGTAYSGGRFAAQKKRVADIEAKIDDLRATYPIDAGALKGHRPTDLINQGEVAIESLSRSRFGIPVTSAWQDDDYAELEVRMTRLLEFESELTSISTRLTEWDDDDAVTAWRQQFASQINAGDVEALASSIERCQAALDLIAEYESYAGGATDTALDLSGLERQLAAVRDPTRSLAEGALDHCLAATEFIDTYETAVPKLSQYDLQRVRDAGQRAFVVDDEQLTDTAARLTNLTALLETAAEAEVKRRQLDLEYSDLQPEEFEHEIQRALSEQSVAELEDIHSLIENLSAGVWQRSHLYEYSPTEFEHLVAKLYTAQGYQARVTQESNDQGIDVVADGPEGTLVIQVKQYSQGNRVGRPTIQQTAGARDLFDADRAVVVTSSEFTSTAEDASRQYGSSVELVDGDDLLHLLSRSSMAPPVGRSTGRTSGQQHSQTGSRARGGAGRQGRRGTGSTTGHSQQAGQNVSTCMVCGKQYRGDLYEVQAPDGRTISCCARCKQLIEEETGPTTNDVEEACDILGVQPDASEQQIKDAYRKQVKNVHPDHGGDRDAFIELREAYELLLDEQ